MHTSPTETESFPDLGHAIGERYHLDREVERSEAGVLYEATDRRIKRRVAVEVASSLAEPTARSKWVRDAMMAQRLEGEHVLHVLDVGTLPNGMPYVVRELAVATLAAELEVRGALPVDEAVGWTLEACEAVAEAHAIGMAHGDLRLENVYLARGANGMTVKVAWNSAAKAERAAKEDVARDIEALGAMLRTLVSGRFDQDSESATTLPSSIAHVVARALAQEGDSRFHNVAELARTLAPSAPPGHGSARSIAFMLSRAGIVGGAIPLPPAAPDRASLSDEWFGARSRRSLPPALGPAPHKRGAAFTLVSLALVGFVLGGCWFLWQSGKLPRWTGTAPAEEVGTTHVTSAPAPPAEPAPTVLEPLSTPVEELPNAVPLDPVPEPVTAPAAAPGATVAPASKGTSELRYVEPNELPATTEPASTAPAPTMTATPADTESAPSSPGY